MCVQHSLLFVSFVNQRAVRTMHAAWSVKSFLRMNQDSHQSHVARVSVISSTPMPSNSFGPDMYTGEARACQLARSNVALPIDCFVSPIISLC